MSEYNDDLAGMKDEVLDAFREYGDVERAINENANAPFSWTYHILNRMANEDHSLMLGIDDPDDKHLLSESPSAYEIIQINLYRRFTDDLYGFVQDLEQARDRLEGDGEEIWTMIADDLSNVHPLEWGGYVESGAAKHEIEQVLPKWAGEDLPLSADAIMDAVGDYMIDLAVDYKCECSDPGCPACGGQCAETAEIVLYRIGENDETGTMFCADCANDALDSGVFAPFDWEDGVFAPFDRE